jgi:hypothetical protein
MYPLAVTVNVTTPEQFAALSAFITGGDVPAVIRPNRPQPATPVPTPTQPSSDAGTTVAKPDTAAPAASTPSSEQGEAGKSSAPSGATPAGAATPTATAPTHSDPGEAYKVLATEFKAFAGKDITAAKALLAKWDVAKCPELKAEQYAGCLADVRAAAAPKQEASV